jgi:cytochrome P450
MSTTPLDATLVVDFRDAVEIFRSSNFTVLLHDGTQEFRGGTLRMIDGEHHLRRRKMMSGLFRGGGNDWFRQHALLPMIEESLAEVFAGAAPGEPARSDLVPFVRRAFFRLAAAVIGLRGVDSLESAEELRQLCEPINDAMRSWYMEGDREALLARGRARKEDFREQYFQPALVEHAHLKERVDAGELDASELPHDFLSLVVAETDPEWLRDHDLPVREAITDMINAGTFSSSFTLIHTVDECLAWLDEHNGDRASMADPAFVYRMAAESLRLHPVVPYLFRVAGDDTTLPSGRSVQAGEVLCIDVRPANRDRTVFGEDADTFDPQRELPKGVYPFGLAFGTGRHMCFGFPIIIGTDGTDGSHTQMVCALFAAGIERDPDSPPVWNDDTRDLALWSSYPVLFRGS